MALSGNLTEILSIIGAVTGLTTFVWRLSDEFEPFLRIALSVDTSVNGWVTFKTTVDNKSYRAKKIQFAMILVGPARERPVQTANALLMTYAPEKIANEADDFVVFQGRGTLSSKNRAVIDLPFYYSENIDIADETLGYRAVLRTDDLVQDEPYSVRFYLFGIGWWHRFTQETFILPNAQSSKD